MIVGGTMAMEKINPWRLNGEGEKILAHTLQVLEERQERIETMTPLCPVDGLPGTYYKSIGTGHMGRVAFQYKCPNDDIFGWDFGKNVSYLIGAFSQGSTPSEAK